MNGFHVLIEKFPDTSWAVDESMAGAREAIREGDTIFVSPAMGDLIEHAANLDELHFLMAHLPVRKRRPVLV